MSAKTEGNAEYIRRLREEAVARGDCYTCRKRPAKPATRYCILCLKRNKDKKAAWSGRKCQRCGVRVRRVQLCMQCTIKASAYFKKRSDNAVAAGLCSRCQKRPLQPGYKKCLECLDAGAARTQANDRAAGAAPTAKCRTCKALGIESTGHDHRTHDRWMARRGVKRPPGLTRKP